MKPENLKWPYPWDERKIIIKDRIWYIPDRCEGEESFSFPGWNHPDVFDNDQPVCIEYCSGNGAWVAAKALAHPNVNWVAVEKRFPRVRKIWSKIKNQGLKNLFVICGEGYNATKCYFPSHSVDKIFINFPDPWPKHRHAKYRLVQKAFTLETSRIMKEGAQITVVTDDGSYSKEILHVLRHTENMAPVFEEPYFVNELENYGSSYFDQLWREKGKSIYYHQFVKRATLL